MGSWQAGEYVRPMTALRIRHSQTKRLSRNTHPGCNPLRQFEESTEYRQSGKAYLRPSIMVPADQIRGVGTVQTGSEMW